MIASPVRFLDPALTEIDVTFGSASDHYHASGCGQYVYKHISFIKRILPYHLCLLAHALNNQSLRYVECKIEFTTSRHTPLYSEFSLIPLHLM